MLEEFKEFAIGENVLDRAIGVIIGGVALPVLFYSELT